MKIAKLMPHSICIHYVHTSLHYTAIFTVVKMTFSDEKVLLFLNFVTNIKCEYSYSQSIFLKQI